MALIGASSSIPSVPARPWAPGRNRRDAPFSCPAPILPPFETFVTAVSRLLPLRVPLNTALPMCCFSSARLCPPSQCSDSVPSLAPREPDKPSSSSHQDSRKCVLLPPMFSSRPLTSKKAIGMESHEQEPLDIPWKPGPEWRRPAEMRFWPSRLGRFP